MTEQSLTDLAALSASILSDALDRVGIAGQCAGIMPLDRSFRVVGRAWTLRYGPVGHEPGTVGDYIDDLGPGEVVTLDNQSRPDVTVWGDLLTTVAAARGVAGTVIDGVCRDVGRSLELGYPIFSRGNWMRTGKDRVRVEQTGRPVAIGGVRIEQGDFLVGDADGLVAVPAARAEEVIAIALEIEAAEDAIRAAVAEGASLREARAAVGYHTLQRRSGR
jgi:regulator of RNase E activity RraA